MNPAVLLLVGGKDANRSRSRKLVENDLRPGEVPIRRMAGTAINSQTRQPMMDVWVYVTNERVLLVDTKRRGGLLETIDLASIRGTVKQDKQQGDVFIAHEVSSDTLALRCIHVAPADLSSKLAWLINEARKDVAGSAAVVDDGTVERAIEG